MYLLCILYSSLYLAPHVSGAIAPIFRTLNLTVVKVQGCSSQYLLQWINTPKLLHIPMAVGYSWSS
jgi:hypothetical protein